MMAYKSKGMKAPRPAAHKQEEGAQSKAPATKPSMQHKEPSHALGEGAQSKAPDHKKKALPTKDAPPGAKGVNEGSSMELPKSGCPGESEV
jgi:hypothetical protein